MKARYLPFLFVGVVAVRREKGENCEADRACEATDSLLQKEEYSEQGMDKRPKVPTSPKASKSPAFVEPPSARRSIPSASRGSIPHNIRETHQLGEGLKIQSMHSPQQAALSTPAKRSPTAARAQPKAESSPKEPRCPPTLPPTGESWFVDVGNGEIKVYNSKGVVQGNYGYKAKGMNTPERLKAGLQMWLQKEKGFAPTAADHIFLFGTQGVRDCKFDNSQVFQGWATEVLSEIGRTPGKSGTWHFSVLTASDEAIGQAKSVKKVGISDVKAMVAPGSSSVQIGIFDENNEIDLKQTDSVSIKDEGQSAQKARSDMMRRVALHLKKFENANPRVIVIGSAAYVAAAAGIIDQERAETQTPLSLDKAQEALTKFQTNCGQAEWLQAAAGPTKDSCEKVKGLLDLLEALQPHWDEFQLSSPTIDAKMLFARDWTNAKGKTMITLADGIVYEATTHGCRAPSTGTWSTSHLCLENLWHR